MMYVFPYEDGRGPTKSIPQQSKTSTSMIFYNDISFLLEIPPVL